MIIECFGLPGAGKTTIARGLAARLPAEVVGVDGRRDLVMFNLRALLRHPLRYGRRTLRAFHEPGSRDLQYYKLRHLFLYRNAVVEKARSVSRAIVDEGHVSNILSAFEAPLSEARVLRELALLDLPDVLLRVTAPTEERKRRLAERGYFSRSGESEEYLRRWEQAMEANDEMVARAFRTLGRHCVEVDGTSELDAVQAALAHALNEAAVPA